jgi:hypothetical protein
MEGNVRLRCGLQDYMRENAGEWHKTALAKELEMDARTVVKLAADLPDDPWTLSRAALYRYIAFATRHGFLPFVVEQHPVWSTFKNCKDPIVLLRGPYGADAMVEVQFGQHFGAGAVKAQFPDRSDVEALMKEQNCIVIGSPKRNPSSEVALARLWGGEPYNALPENRNRMPVHFLGMQPEPEDRHSALLRSANRYGLDIQLPHEKKRQFLEVDWVPPDRYAAKRTVAGQDAAAVVACFRPFGTERNVTTIVVAGYTARATLFATKQLIEEALPDFDPSVAPGEPHLSVLKFEFNERAGREHNKLVSKGWGPPWPEEFFTKDAPSRVRNAARGSARRSIAKEAD